MTPSRSLAPRTQRTGSFGSSAVPIALATTSLIPFIPLLAAAAGPGAGCGESQQRRAPRAPSAVAGMRIFYQSNLINRSGSTIPPAPLPEIGPLASLIRAAAAALGTQAPKIANSLIPRAARLFLLSILLLHRHHQSIRARTRDALCRLQPDRATDFLQRHVSCSPRLAGGTIRYLALWDQAWYRAQACCWRVSPSGPLAGTVLASVGGAFPCTELICISSPPSDSQQL